LVRVCYKVPEIATLPYELFEKLAYCIDSGENLFNWLTACEGCAGNLGDLLILRLPQIAGHSEVSLKEELIINMPLNAEECQLIGKISSLYTRITFGISCLTTLLSIELSSRPTVSLDLTGVMLDNQFACDMVSNFLKACSGKVHLFVFRRNKMCSTNKACKKLVNNLCKASLKAIAWLSCVDAEYRL
jgi:hypothetical protein